jgi:site-specific recombinase XerD
MILPTFQPFFAANFRKATAPTERSAPPPIMIKITVFVSHIVADAHGNTMSKSAFVKMWNPVKESVPFEIGSHMLRHTYCTWLYDNGIDLKTAKDLMGHSDIRITDRIYPHIGEKQRKNANQKISKEKNKIIKNSVKALFVNKKESHLSQQNG